MDWPQPEIESSVGEKAREKKRKGKKGDRLRGFEEIGEGKGKLEGKF